MPRLVDNDGHIGRYLAAQPELNTSLEFNGDSGVLYDASLAGKSHAHTALVAGAGMSRAMASKYAQFVGPGMLSGLMVAPSNVDDDKNKAPATSLGSQFTKLSDALQLGNDHTEMVWIGPITLKTDRSPEAPRHHDVPSILEVDDGLAGIDQGAEVSVILPMKICGALAAMGYDAKTVYKVGKLVRDNMMTGDSPASASPMIFSDVSGGVEKILDGFFKPWSPNEKRVRSVHFNSNEPVLLINDFGRLGGVKLGAIVTEVLEQLQTKHNTWPVRVYAGTFIEGDDVNGSEFSVTLLNVQNTEIGGPSMIQLLDHPCNNLGWNGCMRREVWNGRELLERVEKEEVAIREHETLDEKLQSVLIARGDEEGAVEEEEVVDQEDFEEDIVDEEESEDGAGPERSGYVYDDPHKDRGPIHHPTWEHSTMTESLIDLVQSQGFKDPPGGHAGDSPQLPEIGQEKVKEKARTESTASEDYVVL